MFVVMLVHVAGNPLQSEMELWYVGYVPFSAIYFLVSLVLLLQNFVLPNYCIQSAADLPCFLGERKNARYIGQHGISAFGKIEVKNCEYYMPYGIQFSFFLLFYVSNSMSITYKL